MDKVLETASYGLCLFSLEVMLDFLKKEKIRSKKLLDVFQKNHDRYLSSLKEGVWFPIPEINSIEYVIKLEGCDQPFCEEWEQKFEYSGFNIHVRYGLWIADIGHLLEFDKDELAGNEASYQTLDGETIYSGHKYDVLPGKYLVTVKGFARKEPLAYPSVNYGFSFALAQTEGFTGCNDPRENEIYTFNIANM